MSRVGAREELCFLIGTTASGKTALSLEVAERAGAEIVSMDSMLVYRGMDIGTAKPGASERARVPHFALDLVEPCATFTVQHYLAAAESVLQGIALRGRRALFVGGTALYLKVLVHGMFRGPDTDPSLRSELERRFDREGPGPLHAELAQVDPRSSARIHAHDKKRVVRALEVWRQTGRPLSDWQREWGTSEGQPRKIVGLRVETAELDRRIVQRTRAMLDAGWAEEAARIRATSGFSPTSVQALGYADALGLADAQIDRARAEQQIRLATRQFARRQRTWFRKFPETRWLESPSNSEDLAARASEVLEVFGWQRPTTGS